MKIIARSVVIIALVSVVLAPLGALAAEKAASETPAAVVNGTTITQEALAFETQRMIEQMARQRQGQVPDEASMPQVREDVLNRMIEEELLYQDSQKEHMQVDNKAVDEKYGEIKKRFKTEQEFKDAIAKIDVTEAEIRSQLKKGLAIDELLKTKVVKDIQVTE